MTAELSIHPRTTLKNDIDIFRNEIIWIRFLDCARNDNINAQDDMVARNDVIRIRSSRLHCVPLRMTIFI